MTDAELIARVKYLERALRQIFTDASARRRHAIEPPRLIAPYAETESETYCYWRGYREGLMGIDAVAHDAIKGTWNNGNTS